MIPCDNCIEIECDNCPLWDKYKGGQTEGAETSDYVMYYSITTVTMN